VVIGLFVLIRENVLQEKPDSRWWSLFGEDFGDRGEDVTDSVQAEHLRELPDVFRIARPSCERRPQSRRPVRPVAGCRAATAERKHELRIQATRQARQSPLFFDLTISLSKSISIFHASLGENARLARQAGDQAGDAYWSGLAAEVDDMIWQAVWAGFAYFQREAGYTRTGSHNARVHGRETGQWREARVVDEHRSVGKQQHRVAGKRARREELIPLSAHTPTPRIRLPSPYAGVACRAVRRNAYVRGVIDLTPLRRRSLTPVRAVAGTAAQDAVAPPR
jgi:hypothetical protein